MSCYSFHMGVSLNGGNYPTTMGLPTKHDHFGVKWGYHHLRKHPYLSTCQSSSPEAEAALAAMNQQPTPSDVQPEEGDSGEVAPKVEERKGQGIVLPGGGNSIFLFSPLVGEDDFPIWRAYFSKGLKPPSSLCCFTHSAKWLLGCPAGTGCNWVISLSPLYK